METRIAVIGIVVESEDSVEALNEILHDYREHIIGRMGIPYRQKGAEHHQHRRGRPPRM